MAKNINPTKVITGKDTRWSYCNVWDAKSINGGTPKFSVSLIIPKSDEATVRKIKAAIDAAYHDGESKLRGNGKTVPPLVAIKTPPARRRHGAPRRSGLQERLLRQRELCHRAGCGRCGLQSHPDPQRGLLRRVRSRQHFLLRLQLKRQSRHRLRAQQPAEDS